MAYTAFRPTVVTGRIAQIVRNLSPALLIRAAGNTVSPGQLNLPVCAGHTPIIRKMELYLANCLCEEIGLFWFRCFRIVVVLVIAMTVAVLDGSNTELRLAPFYFVSIALSARWFGRNSTFLMAAFCAALWLVSNILGGMRYSSDWIWGWNAAAEASAFVFVAVLFSQLRASLTKEHLSARSDNLTGLPNSRAFHEQAPLLLDLCHRENHPVALAYIDLDNFKQVNDIQGHHRGDEILRIAAQVMRANLRTSDLLARFGGDEFAVLLPNASNETTREILGRLCQSIESRMMTEECAVTASIGAVIYEIAPASLKELIQSADSLMYEVKNSGKNRVQTRSAHIP